MRFWIGVGAATLGAVLLVVGVAQDRRDAAPGFAALETPAPADGRRAPVLVELFTSEGCSSCPAADALLARLEKTQPVAGAFIIPLEHHVDYWNHLGWRDPFSSAQASARQNDYAGFFGNRSVYTPQMVVDGRAEFVGSSEARARQEIARAARAQKANAHIAPAGNGVAENASRVAFEIRIERLAEATPGDTPEVYLAITESDLHSDVMRGENAGRPLDHIGVVRELRQIGTANAQALTAFAGEPGVTIPSGWKRNNLRVVVFVQERRSRRILAAAQISLAN